MYRISIFILCLFGFGISNAQLTGSLRKEVKPKVPLAYETTYKSQLVLPELYASGFTDSLKSRVEIWRSITDESDLHKHALILLELQEGKMQPKSYPNLWIQLSMYKEGTQGGGAYFQYRDYYTIEWPKVEKEYYTFLKSWAQDLLEKGISKNEMEIDILRFYAGQSDVFLSKLKKEKYKDTPIQLSYTKALAKLKYYEGLYFAVYGGTWVPTNNLSRLGVHPEIGIKVGYFVNRFSFDLLFGLRFLDAPEDYRVLKNDSIYESDQHTGIQVGGQMSYTLIKGIKNQFDVTSGLAYDQINMISGDQEAGIDPVTIRSLNINIGLEYRYYYNIKNYFALNCSYNFLSYENNINDNLFGNAVSLRLIWGFTEGHTRKNALQRMGY